MSNFKIWNKQDDIMGIEANFFLQREPFKSATDIILIYDEHKVVSIECKNIIAKVFNVDENLSLNDFMEEYFEKKNKTVIHTDSQNGEYYEFDDELQEELAQSNEENIENE